MFELGVAAVKQAKKQVENDNAGALSLVNDTANIFRESKEEKEAAAAETAQTNLQNSLRNALNQGSE